MKPKWIAARILTLSMSMLAERLSIQGGEIEIVPIDRGSIV
jgi:hypothetical protein